MAEVDPSWEGGCLSEAPEPLPGNRFIWYVYQRCLTQWDYSDFSGAKRKLDYTLAVKCFEEAGVRGAEFFDQLERLQIIEFEVMKMEAEAREIERGREEARKQFGGATQQKSNWATAEGAEDSERTQGRRRHRNPRSR